MISAGLESFGCEGRLGHLEAHKPESREANPPGMEIHSSIRRELSHSKVC